MTKIEEVARAIEAILAREVRCGQDPALPADDQCKTTWLPYKRHCPECPLHHTQRADVANEMARAAIEAMRVPTEEMERRMAVGGCCSGYVDIGWRNAIDAALAEGPK